MKLLAIVQDNPRDSGNLKEESVQISLLELESKLISPLADCRDYLHSQSTTSPRLRILMLSSTSLTPIPVVRG